MTKAEQTAAAAATWERLYPNATHSLGQRETPLGVQNFGFCSDNYACAEFSEAESATGLRLCYSFYGLGSVDLGQNWAFCRAGHFVEDIDLLIQEQDDEAAERDVHRLAGTPGGYPKSPALERKDPYMVCRHRRRDGSSSGGDGDSSSSSFSSIVATSGGSQLPFPVLRLGTALGLRSVINGLAVEALSTYATDAKYAEALCREKGGNFCPPVAMAPQLVGEVPSLLIKGTAMDCKGHDPHDRLPGTPDLYAQMVLGLVAVKAAAMAPGASEQCGLGK